MLGYRLRQRRERLQAFSINRLLPNIVTLLALCAGLTAIRFALQARWPDAVVAIIIAAVFDALDGRLARRLNVTSRFGAELDSLSDFISFGVAPALMLYLWTMNTAGSIGWAAVLLFPVCCALRLARFNTAISETPPEPWRAGFFTGVPAPAGAGLVLLPMMISFEAGDAFFRHPAFVGVVLAGVGALMVSRIPTFSFKRGRVPRQWVMPIFILVSAVAAVLVTSPWIGFPMLAGLYVATFPLSIMAAAKARRAAANDDAARHASAAAMTPPAAAAAAAPAEQAPPRRNDA